MPLASHLERRDAVYYGRRRPPAEIACRIGRSHLKISLRTMDSKNYGKSPQDRICSIGEIRKKATALKSAQRGLAIGARNRHWTFIGQLIAFGRAQGLRIDPT